MNDVIHISIQDESITKHWEYNAIILLNGDIL